MTDTLLVSGQAAGGGGGGFSSMVVPLLLMFAVMYFLLIRPQQKQVKEQRNMLSALKKGDDVVTQGGLFGKVFQVTEKVVTLEVANNVRVRVLKSSIQGKVAGEEEESKVDDKQVEGKKEEK